MLASGYFQITFTEAEVLTCGKEVEEAEAEAYADDSIVDYTVTSQRIFTSGQDEWMRSAQSDQCIKTRSLSYHAHHVRIEKRLVDFALSLVDVCDSA